jgi:hypothetical protein
MFGSWEKPGFLGLKRPSLGEKPQLLIDKNLVSNVVRATTGASAKGAKILA